MEDLKFEPGRNCWRVEQAERLSVIVDGADYFRMLREVLIKAERLIMLVGWDFDFEIEMLPGESDKDGYAPDGLPNQIGPFLDALVDRRKGLDIYLLKWSGGALIAPGGILPAMRVKFLTPEQIHLAFDGRHPIGACHHQKLVSVDDSIAFCGGIDMTAGRWDTQEHRSGDPNRISRDGEVMQPWHDVTTIMTGPAATAISQLCRDRWKRANDAEMEEKFQPGASRWSKELEPDFRDVDVAISRTEPPEVDKPITAEIEKLFRDSIASAQDYVYIESQYFASDSITEAVLNRLQEADGPEFVVINPEGAQTEVEDKAMHVTRGRMMRQLQASDPHDRFRILYPVNASGEAIYVHAKVTIIDDRMLRVGSANLDRRSMGFDTECDVAILVQEPADRKRIRAIRNDLVAEHLGCSAEELGRAVNGEGNLIGAIDALNHPSAGRGLYSVQPRKEGLVERFLADTRFFDPRYRHSAQARLGITSRHVMIGGALIAAGVLLWSRHRSKRRAVGRRSSR